MAGGKFNILHSKVKLQVPLSQLHYDARGFRFKWNEVWLAIPYEQQPLEIKDGHLLEEFKNNLKSEITICLRWHRIFHKIEGIEVITDNSVSNEVANITSLIKQVTSEIQSLAAAGTLTLDEARDVLTESGLKYNDENIHRILSEIVNNMPLQQSRESVEVPLVHLQYSADGIKFSWGDAWFQVDKDGLPFETGPILEENKGRLEGTITFRIEGRYLVRWDRKDVKLWVGQVSKGVEQTEIDPKTLEKFKELRGNMICDKIRAIDLATLSLDDVEAILKGWGLDLNNREIGERIVFSIPHWTVTWSFRVPAKGVIYSDSDIVISSDGEDVSIPSKELPFETSDVLEKIKDILEGDIEVTIRQHMGFIWDETRQQLAIEPGDTSYDVTVEDKLLERIEYVNVTVNTLKKIYPYDWFEKIKNLPIFTPGGVHLEVIEGDYNKECIRILEELVEKSGGSIYMTSIDLWFRIGDVLVWERPVYGAASYIFDWPEQPLSLFIWRIWGLTLEFIRDNPSISGYIDRVFHDPDDVSNWKWNLINKI